MEFLNEGCVKNNEILPSFGHAPMILSFWHYDSAREEGYFADYLPEAVPESKAPGSFYEQYSRIWPTSKPEERRDEEDEDERDFDPERNGRDTIGRVIKNACSMDDLEIEPDDKVPGTKHITDGVEIIKWADSDEPWNKDWDHNQPDKNKYDEGHDNSSNNSGSGSGRSYDYGNNSNNEFNCPTQEYYW